MTRLYKNTSRIAASIVATMVLSIGTAVALTRDSQSATNSATASPAVPHADTIGRFVVTPTTAKFVAPATETVGRLVVSQHSAVFIPDQSLATV